LLADACLKKGHTLRTLVLLSGVWNLSLGVCIAVPRVAPRLGITTPHVFWTLMLVGVLWVTGVVLVLASRDLRHRASIVYWEGLSRVVAAIVLLTIGHDVLGPGAWLIGVTDIAWAIVYAVGLPRAVGASHLQLLLDRVPSEAR